MNKRTWLIIIIILGLFISLFTCLGSTELRAEEPRRAIVAMEMVLSDQYIVPKINGWDYFNKPPLFNWLLALFFKLFHSFDEWLVRTPSILSFLATSALNYIFVKKYLNKETALYSSLFFLTSADIFFYGTITAGEIDLFFSLLVYLQAICTFHFYQQKNYLRMFLASYLFTALGVLTKGPPSIAFQGITLITILAYNKNLKLLFKPVHFAGIGLFLAVCFSYFYAYSKEGDVAPYMIHLFKEASQKSGFESKLPELITGILTFPFNLIKLLLPWSLLAIYLFSKRSVDDIRKNQLLMFCTLFVLTNIPLYWFTGIPKNRYIYMFFPFIYIIIAHIQRQQQNDWPVITKTIETIFTIAACALPLFFIVLPFIDLHAKIDHITLKASALFLASGIIAFLFFKLKEERILLLTISLIIARLGSDLFYMPILQHNSNTMVYRKHLNNIMEIVKDEKVYLGGKPYTFNSDLSVGPLKIKDTQITTAPLLCYSIPYYYSKYSGNILQFEEKMIPDRYYLVYTEELQNINADYYYTFRETWIDKDMSLIKIKK